MRFRTRRITKNSTILLVYNIAEYANVYKPKHSRPTPLTRVKESQSEKCHRETESQSSPLRLLRKCYTR